MLLYSTLLTEEMQADVKRHETKVSLRHEDSGIAVSEPTIMLAKKDSTYHEIAQK